MKEEDVFLHFLTQAFRCLFLKEKNIWWFDSHSLLETYENNWKCKLREVPNIKKEGKEESIEKY